MKDNKVAARNAAFLFLRMLLMTSVSLYTTRVIINALGAEDYGIYNIAGGIAIFFSFLNNALYDSTQRFLTFEIGKGVEGKIKEIFSACINCHIVIALSVILLSELAGVWFLNYHLNIPPSKLFSANIVFQLSLISFLFSVINAPYVASIIAHEKMTYFALTGIINSILRLLVAYLIMIDINDRLVFYSILMSVVAFIKFCIDRYYCLYNFKECKYIKYWDKSIYKSILSFSSWNLFKTGAIGGANQGSVILVNLYGGPIANAAFGLSTQVHGALYGLIQNTLIAFNPSIIKKYAIKQFNDFFSLTLLASKLCSYLSLIIIVPLIINMKFILSFWLGEYPYQSIKLCTIVIFSLLLDAIFSPLNTAVMAIGKIKFYQIVSSILHLLILPISLFFLEIYQSIELIYISKIICQLLVLFYTLYFLKSLTQFPLKKFLFTCILKTISLLIIDLVLMHFYVSTYPIDTFINFIILVILNIIILLILIFFVGLSKSEQKTIINLIREKLIS